jgi:hypothetical protein
VAWFSIGYHSYCHTKGDPARFSAAMLRQECTEGDSGQLVQEKKRRGFGRMQGEAS